MVAGLVAMHIAANQACRIHILVVLIAISREFHAEEFVQVGGKLFLAAHAGHHAIHILGRVEREIQRVSLDESLSYGLLHIEHFAETAPAVTRPAESDGRVEYIPII